MLDAAARLFGSQRFHEVRMEDIAAEAGVGKGTLYRYFTDKDELFMALLERSARHLQERIHGMVERARGPRAQLEAITAGIIQFFDEQPHLLDLIQRAEVMRGPDFPWKQTRDVLIHMVLDLLQEAKDKGEFDVRDPELVALLLLAGLRGVLRFGTRPRARDIAKRIVDGLLQGFQTPALAALKN
jgi:TetR/AcrR family fatty acid metabolism transcriptional regulator